MSTDNDEGHEGPAGLSEPARGAPEAEGSPAGPPAALRAAAVAAVLAAALAAYLPSLGAGFVWDDWDLVVENPHVGSLGGVARSLRELDGASPRPSRQVMRPLRTLSFALDFAAWGLNPRGYHLTAVALHLLTTLAVFAAASALFGAAGLHAGERFLASACAAAVFAVHPANTEAVDFIANRADLLAAPMLLLAFASYARGRGRAGVRAWAPAALLYAAALLAKETAIVLPAALLLFDVALPPPGRSRGRQLRSRLPAYAVMLAVAAAYLAARRWACGPMPHLVPWGGSCTATALMMVKAASRYARLILLPVSLSARHEIPPVSSPLDAEFISGLLVIAAFACAVAWAARRSPAALVGLGWGAIFLAPVSNVIPIPGAMLAEHWLYVPLFGAAAVFAAALAGLARGPVGGQRRGRAALAGAVMLAAVGLLGARTVLRHEVWTNDETLFRSILAERPGDVTARMNLAEFYLKVGDIDDAEREYRCVTLIQPGNALAHFQVGRADYDYGKLDDAQRHLEAAAAAGTMADPHFVLAQTFEAKGMKEEAARHYRAFIRMAEAGFEVPYGSVAAAKIRLQVIEGAAQPPPTGPGGGGAKPPPSP